MPTTISTPRGAYARILYGIVTPERIEAETRDLARRQEQLRYVDATERRANFLRNESRDVSEQKRLDKRFGLDKRQPQLDIFAGLHEN